MRWDGGQGAKCLCPPPRPWKGKFRAIKQQRNAPPSPSFSLPLHSPDQSTMTTEPRTPAPSPRRPGQHRVQDSPTPIDPAPVLVLAQPPPLSLETLQLALEQMRESSKRPIHPLSRCASSDFNSSLSDAASEARIQELQASQAASEARFQALESSCELMGPSSRSQSKPRQPRQPLCTGSPD